MDNKTEIRRLEDRIRQMNIENENIRKKQEKQNAHIKMQEEKIEEYKKQIEELKKEDAVWKPKQDKQYYYIALGDVEWSKFNNDVDEDNYEIGNCFKTKEEAEKVVRHLKTRAKLQRIADRLNKGQEIDWKDTEQPKYEISYNCTHEIIDNISSPYYKIQGAIYCLDRDFKNIAIKEIGKEELIAYLKGE